MSEAKLSFKIFSLFELSAKCLCWRKQNVANKIIIHDLAKNSMLNELQNLGKQKDFVLSFQTFSRSCKNDLPPLSYIAIYYFVSLT